MFKNRSWTIFGSARILGLGTDQAIPRPWSGPLGPGTTAKVSQNRSTFEQLNLLVLAQRDLGRVSPMRRVLLAVLDQAVRMAVLL